MGAFAWCISDIKGISPSICIHKILMEDDAKSTIEHQRTLNPTMKDVVKRKYSSGSTHVLYMQSQTVHG